MSVLAPVSSISLGKVMCILVLVFDIANTTQIGIGIGIGIGVGVGVGIGIGIGTGKLFRSDTRYWFH